MLENSAVKQRNAKILLIIFLIIAITILHYSTDRLQSYHHIIFREFYFLPIILSAFWFGIRGGLASSMGVSLLYLPHVVINWQNFSPDDLDKCVELFFFNVMAVVLGTMKDLELKRQREKEEAISAMAGTIAHELNSPVQVILSSAQLLQDDFPEGSDTFEELKVIVENAKIIGTVIQKISFLDKFVMKSYAGKDAIYDLDAKTQEKDVQE